MSEHSHPQTVGSLLVAATWMVLFPDLRRIDRFEPAEEKQASA